MQLLQKICLASAHFPAPEAPRPSAVADARWARWVQPKRTGAGLSCAYSEISKSEIGWSDHLWPSSPPHLRGTNLKLSAYLGCQHAGCGSVSTCISTHRPCGLGSLPKH